MTMCLGELILHLESFSPDMRVANGFGSAHSDRGDYSNVAFEPEYDTTVGEMLAHAAGALGATFEGWKGGTFTMTAFVDTHIGRYGECGEGIGRLMLGLMLGCDGALPNRYEEVARGMRFNK